MGVRPGGEATDMEGTGVRAGAGLCPEAALGPSHSPLLEASRGGQCSWSQAHGMGDQLWSRTRSTLPLHGPAVPPCPLVLTGGPQLLTLGAPPLGSQGEDEREQSENRNHRRFY